MKKLSMILGLLSVCFLVSVVGADVTELPTILINSAKVVSSEGLLRFGIRNISGEYYDEPVKVTILNVTTSPVEWPIVEGNVTAVLYHHEWLNLTLQAPKVDNLTVMKILVEASWSHWKDFQCTFEYNVTVVDPDYLRTIEDYYHQPPPQPPPPQITCPINYFLIPILIGIVVATCGIGCAIVVVKRKIHAQQRNGV